MNTTTNDWKDRKKYLWLLSPLLPLLGLLAVGAYAAGAPALLLWTGPILIFAVVPLLDLLVGVDPVNAPESAVPGLIAQRYYKYITYAYIPTQFALTIAGAVLVAGGGLATWELVGLILTVGTINGIGINTAHELGHKTGRLDRTLAKLTLAPVAYGHFFVEHNRGHHKNVATPMDPASSRMGESFWRFLPRTVIGSVRSAWTLETARLKRQGKATWSPHNEVLQSWALTVLLFGSLVLILGPVVLPFLLLQAAYGASLLEVINYIEHYGLLREKQENGRYERCQPHHSWNSNHVVTNLVLYQLQRHSDHHANPTRPFQALRHFDSAPQLPSGYASMLIAAYIPPLWYRLMDPRVVAHYEGDLLKANLHPAKREALLRRWCDSAVPELQQAA